MKSKDTLLYEIKSVEKQNELMGFGKPKHPLISLQRFADISQMEIRERIQLITDFYQITLKKECPCKMKYGQNQYDFNEGVMSFLH